MGVKERREREKQELRSLILDAARELFAAEGYEAVTMRKIADRIEYSPTAIYLHFADKEALLRELCSTDFLALAQQFVRLSRIDDPVERLRRAGHGYVEFGLKSPSHYRLMFMTPHPTIDHADDIEKGNPEQDAYAFLEGTVAECIATGHFRHDLGNVALISQTIWAGVHGVISLEIAKRNDPWVDWQPIAKRARHMVDLLIRGFSSESTATGKKKRS